MRRLTEFAHTGQLVQRGKDIYKILMVRAYEFKLQHIKKKYIVTLSKDHLEDWFNLG